jgi:hypothetical protein
MSYTAIWSDQPGAIHLLAKVNPIRRATIS